MAEKTDPICGMKVDSEEAEAKGLVVEKNKKKYYFCSVTCKNKFIGKNGETEKTGKEKVAWYKSDTFGKVFPYFLGGILILGTILSIAFDFMILYMGIFFIIFSLFKMPDWKGFVKAFGTYDILAKNIKLYGWAYPAIEMILGIAFILNYFSEFYLVPVAWTTLAIMAIGSVGVSIKLLKKEKFQCACLGTWINVPLTKVTLLEDLLMVFMSVRLLFF